MAAAQSLMKRLGRHVLIFGRPGHVIRHHSAGFEEQRSRISGKGGTTTARPRWEREPSLVSGARLMSGTTSKPVVEPLSQAALDGLASILGSERISTGLAVRQQHGKDESYHSEVDGVFPPQAVVFPRSNEEVSAVVKLCNLHGVPIVASGANTSLEGHTAALRGGLGINMREMNSVIEVNSDDLDCRVQAGVTRVQLNKYLHDTGLFFPVDPGADATIGGMTSTRASGTTTIKYGTMRSNVLGLTAVTADGTIVRTGGRSRKSSSGYDLTALLVGSEGTLAIITEVSLRLYGQPEAVSSAVCQFTSVEDAVSCVIQSIQFGIPVARMELLDPSSIQAINKYSGQSLPVTPTLFFEFHGSEKGVEESARQAREVAQEHGGQDFQWAKSAEERSKLWKARHDAYYAALALRPGCKGMVTDACVPISRLAECIAETQRDLAETGLMGPMLGHVGDGNFHLVLLLDPGSEAEIEMGMGFCDRLASRAISMGGTCTGEHGIGYGKLGYLEIEHGDAAVGMMRAIKASLDPNGILNPGKMGSGP